MGRPKTNSSIYESQERYRKTNEGKATEKKYESSEKARKRKRDWWNRNKRKKPLDLKKYFIDTYGDIETALSFLDARETEVIIKIYGLDGNDPVKQKYIAEEWGTSGQWITQIKKEAISKLEEAAKSKTNCIKLKKEKSD